MNHIETVILLGVIGLILLIHAKLEIKIDWNYQTGEKLLWYNDLFSKRNQRKYIVIGRK